MDDQSIYIAIGVLVLILLIYFVYYRPTVSSMVGSPISKYSIFSKKAERMAPGGGPLNCRDPGIISATADFYNKDSQFATVFTMDPISSVQASPTQCDIKYQYIPVPGAARTDSDVDWRRFTYQQDSAGAWSPQTMGEWKSGTMNI